jgi:hypothetical protein
MRLTGAPTHCIPLRFTRSPNALLTVIRWMSVAANYDEEPGALHIKGLSNDGVGNEVVVGDGDDVSTSTVVKNTPGIDCRATTVGITAADSSRTNHELEVSNVLLSQRSRERRTDQQEQWEKH